VLRARTLKINYRRYKIEDDLITMLWYYGFPFYVYSCTLFTEFFSFFACLTVCIVHVGPYSTFNVHIDAVARPARPDKKKSHDTVGKKKARTPGLTKKKKNTYIYIVPINGHIITRNTIRFYVFWGIKYGSAHVNRAGTIKVGKGVYAPD
jgi:hypothetical protein